jgi:hypothetical protein
LRVDSINGGNQRIDYSIQVRLSTSQSGCFCRHGSRAQVSPRDSIITYGAWGAPVPFVELPVTPPKSLAVIVVGAPPVVLCVKAADPEHHVRVK